MKKNRLIGIITYGCLLFFIMWVLMVLKITFFTAIAAILSWIGWTMATALLPKSIKLELTPMTEKGVSKALDYLINLEL